MRERKVPKWPTAAASRALRESVIPVLASLLVASAVQLGGLPAACQREAVLALLRALHISAW